jgi:hypothetical protein
MSAFSDRILAHPQIASITPGGVDSTCVLAMRDQLLVAEPIAEIIFDNLTKNAKSAYKLENFKVTPLARVFTGLNVTPGDDVWVFQLAPSGPTPFTSGALITKVNSPAFENSIFAVIDAIRSNMGPLSKFKLPGIDLQRLVSLNHVLVPAPANAGCPYGPPCGVQPPVSTGPPYAEPVAPVTVVDSGYLWTQTMGHNPLTDIAKPTVKRAERLPGANAAVLRTGSPAWDPAHPASAWETGTPDAVPVATSNAPPLMDALLGHANFVAGVIAQECWDPALGIWSHNGDFVASSDELPTEAAVCRSIIRSQGSTSSGGTGVTSLIHVGFAFALRPSNLFRQTSARDYLSSVWDSVFKHLDPKTVMVAPTGNEGQQEARYPAALPTISPRFLKVLGVASLSRVYPHAGSTFANRGHWVACSTIGEEVVSTFVRIDPAQCEDDTLPRPTKHFADAWAIWNGTSFAAPKMTGALAARATLAAGNASGDVWQAWLSLVATAGSDSQEYGYEFPDL